MDKEKLLKLIKLKIIEVIPNLNETDIEDNQNFQELGTNSIEKMEIIMSIMEDLSLDIPRLELLNVQNIFLLAELLQCKLQDLR